MSGEQHECSCPHCGHLNVQPEPFYLNDVCGRCDKKLKEWNYYDTRSQKQAEEDKE